MRRTALTLFSFFLSVAAACAAPVRSIAMHGAPEPGLPFPHLAYVNPQAPKGGRVKLGAVGSFDNLNPLIVKGSPAAGVRDFQIETLMARDLDQPFTLHGLLAETIDIADDRKSVTFALNPKARFADRSAVRAADVLFSFEVLKTKGRPNHRTYYGKVSEAVALDERTVRFTFQDANDRELPLILGLMPVLSKAATKEETFDQTTLTPLLGSGPYTISRVDPGRSLTFARDPDYWGKDEPVNAGRFNFDEIRFDYYRDGIVMFETFKSGGIDFRLEEDPSTWAGGYEFPAVREGRIEKKEFALGVPAGMTALTFNTRRNVFKKREVREALITLFDAEWINRTLFDGLFKRTQSFFERSYLSAQGKPPGARETELLAPFAGELRPEILAGTYSFPATNGSGQNRDNQRAAFTLLQSAGYALSGGRLTDKETRTPLTFELLAHNNTPLALLNTYVRSLEPLGIAARVRLVDSAQYQARLTTYDYDMIYTTWPSSLSPGNEQLFRWSSKTADAQGSFNYAGVKSPAADAMMQAMLSAQGKEDFVSAVRALDRVLLSGGYVIPLFHVPSQWVAHWSRLKHPPKPPVFGWAAAIDCWWIEEKP
jgi:peptide/nickel transport system substrate-binding protein